MSNMHTRALTLSTLLTLASMSATAQTITTLQKQRAYFWYGPTDICIQKNNDDSVTLSKKLEICEKSLAALKSRVKVNPTQSDYEANYYYFSTSVIHSLISGLYGKMDGVRSTRLCTQVEKQWLTFGKIKPSAWEIESNNIALNSANSVIPVVKKCRAEKGSPDWARPLP